MPWIATRTSTGVNAGPVCAEPWENIWQFGMHTALAGRTQVKYAIEYTTEGKTIKSYL